MSRLTQHEAQTNQAGDKGQILHLKQLLVTLKQQYEKNLHALNEQLQNELYQKQLLKKNLEKSQIELQHGEEELASLRQQQTILRDLLKKKQEELNQTPSSDSVEEQQRIEQLERMIPYWREKSEEAQRELEAAHQKNKLLQEELLQKEKAYQSQIEELQHTLSLSEQNQGSEQGIKSGTREIQILEARYVTILNEKTALENNLRQLQEQFEHQASNLAAFNEQRHEWEQQTRHLQSQLHEKERLLAESHAEKQQIESRLKTLENSSHDKQCIQEKYEQLKEEFIQLSERFDEALSIRIQAENQLTQLQDVVKQQNQQLNEQAEQLDQLAQEKDLLQTETEHFRQAIEDSDMRLKVAQQHLAKKVKESALLSEKVEEQQTELYDLQQAFESAKVQIHQMQGNIDLYQKQEKKLQEQLHDALKGTESQVAKWEEKYFRMYDKWQESENRIRELKKFEEKHLQMQSLLANLGTFMGSSFAPNSSLLQNTSVENHPPSEGADYPPKPTSSEEKYDLFGLRQSQDKIKPHLFS